MELEPPDFSDLPTEIIIKYLLKLDPKSLSRICSANHKLVDICADDRFIEKYKKKYHREIVMRKIAARKKSKAKSRKPLEQIDDINKAMEQAAKTGDVRFYKKWMNYSGWNNYIGFDIAAEHGNENIIKLLLNHGLDPSFNENVAIRHAAENGHENIVKLLLSLPEENNIDPFEALVGATEREHLNIAELAVEDPRIDLSVDDNQIIQMAAERGDKKVVEFLLSLPYEKGVDPSANDNQAIKWAYENGHTEIVNLLLKDSRIDEKTQAKYANMIAKYKSKKK